MRSGPLRAVRSFARRYSVQLGAILGLIVQTLIWGPVKPVLEIGVGGLIGYTFYVEITERVAHLRPSFFTRLALIILAVIGIAGSLLESLFLLAIAGGGIITAGVLWVLRGRTVSTI